MFLAPYLLGVVHVAMTGSIYTTIAVAVERCVTVCAPFTNLKVIKIELYREALKHQYLYIFYEQYVSYFLLIKYLYT